MIACEQRNIEIIKYLIENKTNLNMKDQVILNQIYEFIIIF